MSFRYEYLTLYIKIFVLLYTDDTVIFGTCEADFQDNLDEFHEYAKQWNLDINFSKSEVLVFGTRNDDGVFF